MSEEQVFNEGHIIEGLDRVFIAQCNLDEFVLDHPAVMKAGCNQKVEEAIRLLAEVYQEIGQLSEYMEK